MSGSRKLAMDFFIRVFAKGWEAFWNQEKRLEVYLYSLIKRALKLPETCPEADWMLNTSCTACRHNKTYFWLTFGCAV